MLRVHPSGFCAWVNLPFSPPSQEDERQRKMYPLTEAERRNGCPSGWVNTAIFLFLRYLSAYCADKVVPGGGIWAQPLACKKPLFYWTIDQRRHRQCGAFCGVLGGEALRKKRSVC